MSDELKQVATSYAELLHQESITCDSIKRLDASVIRLAASVEAFKDRIKKEKLTSYYRVRCSVCHWEDALRMDLIAAGDLRFHCDQCNDWTQCEAIPI